MALSTSRGLVPAGLLFLVAACSEPLPPGTGGDESFDLLVERRNAGGARSFYTMDPKGERFAPFAGVPVDARALIPSPDGKTIAYLRNAEGNVELWAMDRDGANRRPILTGAFFVESASWSPDGRKLVLSFSTETVASDIATINADGTGFLNLTPDPLPAIMFDRDAAWSPDGTRIAFSSNRSGARRLWVMNADGANPVQVLPSAVSSTERNPVWSPDTTNFIAVVAVNTAGPGITFVRADGTDYKHVVIPPGPNDPVWLPDGRLVYVANPTGDYDLYSVDRVSGTTTQVTGRRDHDVRATVLTRTAPYTWLGFAQPVSYTLNRPIAVDIAAGDVMADGNQDILVLTPLLNELRLMRGSGNGSVQNVGSLFSESDVFRMATGLVTNDAVTDIVGAGDSAVFVWRGRPDGPGIASRLAMNVDVIDFVLADLDGSGRADIVTLVESTGQPFRLRTHTIDPDDSFVFAVDLGTSRTGARSMCAGDFNFDGRQDVTVLAGSTNLSAFLARGRGELGVDDPDPAGTSLSGDLQAIPYCADFNNDGKDDLALLTVGSSQGVAVHRFGIASFGTASRINATATSLAIADVDRDGDLDIIMASTNDASILVARNRGTGTFDTPTAITLQNTPTLVTVADLNGDTWPDVAAVDVTGQLVVLLSRGRTGM